MAGQAGKERAFAQRLHR